ncbi:hypothetical protein JRQ81_006953 [Phrynocephalus forsythii]|uniref:Uncharacterized protein n=1 Tax=Phrynocephalus forsythii TaxID=171643 RepID=A0A9Q0XFZ4_9SAUR|nr:hypothetical protein JRQ81_006953 [Phrynocephalus forsythii]
MGRSNSYEKQRFEGPTEDSRRRLILIIAPDFMHWAARYAEQSAWEIAAGTACKDDLELQRPEWCRCAGFDFASEASTLLVHLSATPMLPRTAWGLAGQSECLL